MSSTPSAPNSQLPDEEALEAFATNAFGAGRRRRRSEDTGKKEPAAAGPTDQDGTPPEPAPLPEQAPAPTPASAPDVEPEVEPESAEPVPREPGPLASRTTVPAPLPSGQAPPQVPAGRQPQADPLPAQAPADDRAQVAVRAVAAPGTSVHRPVPLAYRTEVQLDQVQVPNLGPSGARATQCTIMISQNVRDRFAQYQLSKKMAGEKEPANSLVVRRAFLHAKRSNLFSELLSSVYQQHNAVDEEDYDEDGMLGEVVGRRAVRGRLKDSGQQSFRPSEQELANYDAFTQAYGFPSRSDFLDAVLDAFLPQLPIASRRR